MVIQVGYGEFESKPVVNSSNQGRVAGESEMPLEKSPHATKSIFSVGEMYSGPGGIAVGAELAKVKLAGVTYSFEHTWATDYDSDTCRTYESNVKQFSPQCQVICTDVRNLRISELPYVDGLLFGFPCNDFSLVGETKGLAGEFGPLYQYGVRYLSEHNPLFFMAENVNGLSSANEGSALSQILGDLARAGKHGYHLTAHLYKFEEYGVPQARHRIIIIGIRKDLELVYRVPRPKRDLVSAKFAIENPPIPDSCPNNELTKQSQTVVERLSFIKPGQNAWTADLPEHLKLNVRGAKLSQIYKRLDPDKPSYTITGSGGGGTHVYHWAENRALTNRERARLQTFPDSFVFYGSKESVRRQIGMAVPPAGACEILRAVLLTLAGHAYAHDEPSLGYF